MNVELVRTVEERPDTIITLLNGDHVLVQESMDEVVHRAVEYGQRLRKLMPPS